VGMVERDCLLHAFDSGYLSSRGEFVKEFEKDFISYLDVSTNQENWYQALVCSSGTAAMHLALLAAGVVGFLKIYLKYNLLNCCKP